MIAASSGPNLGPRLDSGPPTRTGDEREREGSCSNTRNASQRLGALGDLRSFLRDQQIALPDAAMADRFPEDQGDFGVLVTRDRRVFTFLFSVGATGDIQQCTSDVKIANWREAVSAEERFAYSDAIEAALGVLEDERRSSHDA